MIKNLKSKLKKNPSLVHLVRKIRFSLKKKSKPVALRDVYSDIAMLCKKINLNNPIFIDGGAHNGSTILRLRDEGFINSKIFAFEPIPTVAESILKFNDKNVTVFAKAIGNEDGDITFNINSRAVTSSILEPAEVVKYHPGVTDLVKKITVPVVKIDTLIREKQILQPDIIKLDLQGYELQALMGARQALEHVKIVFTEVEFVEFYRNQPLFHDISIFMKENNFSLFNLYNTGSHNGQITEGDALFINNTYFKKDI